MLFLVACVRLFVGDWKTTEKIGVTLGEEICRWWALGRAVERWRQQLKTELDGDITRVRCINNNNNNNNTRISIPP